MRKFGCLLLAVLIFVFGVKPVTEASATGYIEGDSEPDKRYPFLRFDEVSYFSGFGEDVQFYSFAYPFNCFVKDGSSVSFQHSVGVFDVFGSGIVSAGARTRFSSQLNFGAVDRSFVVNLYGGNQYLSDIRDLADLDSFTVSLDSSLGFAFRIVRLTGKVGILLNTQEGPNPVDILLGDYVEFSLPVYAHKVSGSDVLYYHVGSTLAEWLATNQLTEFIYLDSLTLSFEIVNSSGTTEPCTVFFNGGCDGRNPYNRFASWVYGQDIPLVVGGDADVPSDVFSWLINAVEGFLEFQIAPGLSINKILNIVLVIGVMLWFITLLI